jgi:hypothetical protein
MPARAVPDGSFDDFVRAQHGALSRGQALAHGLTDTVIASNLAARRWQRLFRGTYAAFTGPLPYLTRVWAAILYAGAEAMASHETAAWLAGLRDAPPPLVHVTIPVHRRVRRQPGLVIHLSSRAAVTRHPVRTPPQTRVDDTVLDQVEAADTPEQVIDVITRACQRRQTTAARLAAAASRRPNVRWRRLVDDVLEDVRDGVQSALERRWRRDVEMAHGLPTGRRNRPEGRAGERTYRDVRIWAYSLVVELDGAAAHPDDRRYLDDDRDNDLVEAESVATLRYGWRAVAGSPCAAAARTARLLRRGGWIGKPRRCGPHCPAPELFNRGGPQRRHGHEDFPG